MHIEQVYKLRKMKIASSSGIYNTKCRKWEKVSQISLILFFFAKVYIEKNFKIVPLESFISQSFSYFNFFSKHSWFLYLAKYFTLLISQKFIQKFWFFPLVKFSLITVTWKLEKYVLWKYMPFMFLTSLPNFLKNT